MANPSPEQLADEAVRYARLAKASLQDPGMSELASAIEHLALAVGFSHLTLVKGQRDAG